MWTRARARTSARLPRQVIPEFGSDVTASFCAANGIDLVVRSHQFVHRGYKVMHGGHLMTLFSARNYAGGHAKDSALLRHVHNGEGQLRVRAKCLQHHQPAR